MKPGYRKVLLAVLFTFIGLGVELTTKNGLTQGLVELLLGLYGAFAVGNISEHWAATRKTMVTQNVTPPDAELHDKADALLDSQHTAQQALSFLVDFVQKASANAPNNVA